MRLENLINSVNWVSDIAKKQGCDAIYFLGDFFDKPELNAEEISALNELNIQNSGIKNYFIVGNHEIASSDNEYNSIKLFNLINSAEVISTPTCCIVDNNTQILFLPYVLESKREDLIRILEDCDIDKNKKTIIISHNDIKGIQYGMFESKFGFSVEEINENCVLFLNGHLHNSSREGDKIINVGNLSGQNFSEDATRYTHHIYILDTETLDLDEIENPFAFNFYKLDCTNVNPDEFKHFSFKDNAVVCIKAYQDLALQFKEKIDTDRHIVEGRVIAIPREQEEKEIQDITQELSVDHLKAFATFMLDNYPNTDVLHNELCEVCK